MREWAQRITAAADLIKAKQSFEDRHKSVTMGLFYGLFALSVFLSFSVLGVKLWAGSYKVGISHNGTASNIFKLRGSSAALLPYVVPLSTGRWLVMRVAPRP
jgi:hypothetical protein